MFPFKPIGVQLFYLFIGEFAIFLVLTHVVPLARSC